MIRNIFNKRHNYLVQQAYKSISRGTEDEIINAYGNKFIKYSYKGSIDSFYDIFMKSNQDKKYDNIQKYLLAIKDTIPDIGVIYQPIVLVRRSLIDIAYYKNESEYSNKNDRLFVYDIPYMKRSEIYFDLESNINRYMY